MDDTAKQVLGQVLILSIQHLFTMLSMSGMTQEEMEKLFNSELEKFKARPIEDLPEPPK